MTSKDEEVRIRLNFTNQIKTGGHRLWCPPRPDFGGFNISEGVTYLKPL